MDELELSGEDLARRLGERIAQLTVANEKLSMNLEALARDNAQLRIDLRKAKERAEKEE